MIKKIIHFAVFISLLGGILAFNIAPAYARTDPPAGTAPNAQQNLPLDPLDDFIRSIEGAGDNRTGLQKFLARPHRLSSVEPGADIITTVIFTGIDFAKYVLGTIAIIYITVGGIKLITAGKQIDEVSEKQKENLKYILYGLFIAITADALVQQVFFGEYGECIASTTNAQACAEAGTTLIHGVVNFIQFFIATIAVLVIVISGFRLVTSTGDEEVIKTQKTRIAVAIAGLIVVGVAQFVVEDIVFPGGGSKFINVGKAKELIAQITNFAASFIGTLSVIFLIYGGYLYVAGFGNEESIGKAKKVIIGAVIGIFIAFAAFGFVRTVLDIEAAVSDNPAAPTVESLSSG